MPNHDEIIGIYCLLYDVLKTINHREDILQTSDCEILTTAIRYYERILTYVNSCLRV